MRCTRTRPQPSPRRLSQQSTPAAPGDVHRGDDLQQERRYECGVCDGVESRSEGTGRSCHAGYASVEDVRQAEVYVEGEERGRSDGNRQHGDRGRDSSNSEDVGRHIIPVIAPATHVTVRSSRPSVRRAAPCSSLFASTGDACLPEGFENQ